MTCEEARSFLSMHQPMPPTRLTSQQDVEQYDRVRRFLLDVPDSACIALLLNSFGEGDLFGIYQLVPDVIRRFPAKDVIPHLVHALRSPYASVQYWASQVAMYFSSTELVEPLCGLLGANDPDTRYAAVSALGEIDAECVDELLMSQLSREDDPDVIEVIDEVLRERGRSRGQG